MLAMRANRDKTRLLSYRANRRKSERTVNDGHDSCEISWGHVGYYRGSAAWLFFSDEESVRVGCDKKISIKKINLRIGILARSFWTVYERGLLGKTE